MQAEELFTPVLQLLQPPTADYHAWLTDLRQLALTVALWRTKLFKTDFRLVVLIHIQHGSCSLLGRPKSVLPLFVSAVDLKNVRRFVNANSQIKIV
ncbi:MAG: hypothetical protein PUP90_05865 [Nostoc sp. S4]|nr:hypothetical protein [Nostoc sp. S4]